MGRYIRVWVYDNNQKYLDSVDNVGLTVNNAISMYAASSAPVAPLSVMSSVQRSILPPPKPSPICNNGHIMVNAKRCISPACKYGRLDEQPKI